MLEGFITQLETKKLLLICNFYDACDKCTSTDDTLKSGQGQIITQVSPLKQRGQLTVDKPI